MSLQAGIWGTKASLWLLGEQLLNKFLCRSILREDRKFKLASHDLLIDLVGVLKYLYVVIHLHPLRTELRHTWIHRHKPRCSKDLQRMCTPYQQWFQEPCNAVSLWWWRSYNSSTWREVLLSPNLSSTYILNIYIYKDNLCNQSWYSRAWCLDTQRTWSGGTPGREWSIPNKIEYQLSLTIQSLWSHRTTPCPWCTRPGSRPNDYPWRFSWRTWWRGSLSSPVQSSLVWYVSPNSVKLSYMMRYKYCWFLYRFEGVHFRFICPVPHEVHWPELTLT